MTKQIPLKEEYVYEHPKATIEVTIHYYNGNIEFTELDAREFSGLSDALLGATKDAHDRLEEYQAESAKSLATKIKNYQGDVRNLIRREISNA